MSGDCGNCDCGGCDCGCCCDTSGPVPAGGSSKNQYNNIDDDNQNQGPTCTDFLCCCFTCYWCWPYDSKSSTVVTSTKGSSGLGTKSSEMQTQYRNQQQKGQFQPPPYQPMTPQQLQQGTPPPYGAPSYPPVQQQFPQQNQQNRY